MNKNVLSVVAALVVSSSASASLVGFGFQLGPNQHPDGAHTTWQLYAIFDDAGDQISAVNGLIGDGVNTLDFATSDGSDMYNQAIWTGLPFNDFPSAPDLGGDLWDSYVTIGESTFPSNTQFSPDFLGPWGGAPPSVQVILGSSFSESDGAWFFFGAPPAVGGLPDAVEGNDTIEILFAQFTVNAGVNVHLNGNVAWLNALGGSNNTPFSIDTPAPGALALLGLAGLAGTRRRRR